MRHRTRWLAALCLSVTLLMLSPYCGYSQSANQMAGPREGWRRTVQGWQDCRHWPLERQGRTSGAAAVHPLLVGTFELLVSVGALLAFARPSRRLGQRGVRIS